MPATEYLLTMTEPILFLVPRLLALRPGVLKDSIVGTVFRVYAPPLSLPRGAPRKAALFSLKLSHAFDIIASLIHHDFYMLLYCCT